jgi:uncharacterized protein YgiM (DUF1202 family)
MMRISCRALALLCALLLALGGMAMAQELEQAVVNNPNPNDGLFLRADPSTESTPLQRYYNGVTVQVLERAEDPWLKVRAGALEGYMNGRYLALGEEAPTVSPRMPVAVVQNLSPTGVLNLRETPSAAAPVLGTYPNGTLVEVLGTGPDWAHVSVDGAQGFMQASYLSNVAGVVVLREESLTVHPSLPRVTLQLIGGPKQAPDDGSTIAAIRVVGPEGTTGQVFLLDAEGGEPADSDLTQITLTENALRLEDVNFDEYIDLMAAPLPGAQNAYYVYWLFNPASGQFEYSKVFSALEANPVFDGRNHKITASAKNGAADYTDFTYEVADGTPTLVEQLDTHYLSEAQKEMTLWEIQDGILQKTKTWQEAVQ